MNIKKIKKNIKKWRIFKLTQRVKMNLTTEMTLRNRAYLTALIINGLIIVIGLYAAAHFGVLADPNALTLQNIAAINQGKVRMIGGNIESIDTKNRKIVVNTDPLGVGERYVVDISARTGFIKQIYEIERVEIKDIENLETVTDSRYSFSELKTGDTVRVEFNAYIDIDNTSIIMAETITVFEYNYLNSQ
jgi:hypothetical protein